ncbi:hypothetical protein MANES_04G009351v8 [Manihot esculenta]|uniref:Uncharacterized protein n=1 Tax=Manihot esculenta TaxID=3983 RepID=A0ACB7HR10_MANES|nr:hypothetical protein MANES_04G009351v8 [Manihot esculenta]
MQMILLHGLRDTNEEQPQKHLLFSSTFLEKSPYNAKLLSSNFPGNFVIIPDGLHCPTCNSLHDYPSRELNNKECDDFLLLLEHCRCFCAFIGLPRNWLMDYNDFLNSYFSRLNRKFNSLEALMRKNQELEEKSWKLVREIDTTKETFSIGPVLEKLWDMPLGILDDCKISFSNTLNFLYRKRIGFVKGKYLIISTELLFRHCEGDINLFLQHLGKAYSLVQSLYCNVSRMAIEAGFWQLCPEFGGFFWRTIDLKKNFPFLREFMQDKMIFIKNFSLSVGPFYIIGGGYFSYIHNTMGDLVLWYIPNFWDEHNFGYNHETKEIFHNFQHFWYGVEESEFGCHYSGVIQEGCDYNMMQFLLEDGSPNYLQNCFSRSNEA